MSYIKKIILLQKIEITSLPSTSFNFAMSNDVYLICIFVLLQLNDRLCLICEKGGNLIKCSNGCLHSFHKEWYLFNTILSHLSLHLSSMPSGKWKCTDCARREVIRFLCCCNSQHDCFACKHKCPDQKLIQCTIKNCRRYFHTNPNCCGQDLANSKTPFVCPSHVCMKCGGNENPLPKCIRCTRCYHPNCFPSDIIKLDGRYFLCKSHEHVISSFFYSSYRKSQICPL